MLILWDLNKNVQIRIVPTYECNEGLVPIPLGETIPSLKVVDTKYPHVITAGERGII